MQKQTHVKSFSITEIFTNHVRLLRLNFSNQTLETTNRWLTSYHQFRALNSIYYSSSQIKIFYFHNTTPKAILKNFSHKFSNRMQLL